MQSITYLLLGACLLLSQYPRENEGQNCEFQPLVCDQASKIYNANLCALLKDHGDSEQRMLSHYSNTESREGLKDAFKQFSASVLESLMNTLAKAKEKLEPHDPDSLEKTIDESTNQVGNKNAAFKGN